MKSNLTYILLIFCSFLYGYDNYWGGAKPVSMGQAYVMTPDVWSVHYNQAGLAFYNHFALGIHQENRYLIPENAYRSVVLSLPVKFGTFGFNYSFFGNLKYNEKKIGIAYSKKIMEKLSLGVGLNLLNTFIADYGKETRPCIEIGLMAKPLENLYVGIHAFNPNQEKFNYVSQTYIPGIFRLGIGYHIEELIMFNAEVEKETNEIPNYKAGIEYYALQGLFVRVGFLSKYSRYAFGLGYVYKKITADIAFMSNRELGFTPHFSMCYAFN